MVSSESVTIGVVTVSVVVVVEVVVVVVGAGAGATGVVEAGADGELVAVVVVPRSHFAFSSIT